MRHRIYLWQASAFFWLLAVALFVGSYPAHAEPVDYLFWHDGCPHCERARAALDEISTFQPGFRLVELQVGASEAEDALFADAARRLGLERPTVPLFVVGNTVLVGFSAGAGTATDYSELIQGCIETDCDDLLGVAAQNQLSSSGDSGMPKLSSPDTVRIPFVGEVPTTNLSLPALTILLAAIDGFNPCAMWVLAILIGFLLAVEDRARMWTLGVVFLLTTGLMYFAIMAAWLNVILWIGALSLIRLVVGAVALAAGLYYLRVYWTNPEGVCRVTPSQQRKSITGRFRSLVEEPSLAVASLGIAALAIGVNLIELVCSAGVPAVFTQVLAMHDLPKGAYYGYLILYILVFLLDDTVIFVTAMLTLRSVAGTIRYTRISHLAGGVVLICLGTIMILRPELLA